MPITDLIPSIIYGAVLLFILGALAALWNRMGSILRDIGRLDADVAGNRVSINEKTEALQTSINEKTEALQTSLNEKTEALQTSLNEKTEALQTSINEKTEALQTSINEKTEALQTSINEKTEALQTSINEKTEALQTSINEKTEALQTSINEKTEALQTSLNEVKTTVVEMRLQMQRNHYQLMMAILSHSHRPDGRPTFDLPPDFEPTSTEGGQ